jgi:hypothetical protein
MEGGGFGRREEMLRKSQAEIVAEGRLVAPVFLPLVTSGNHPTAWHPQREGANRALPVFELGVTSHGKANEAPCVCSWRERPEGSWILRASGKTKSDSVLYTPNAH